MCVVFRRPGRRRPQAKPRTFAGGRIGPCRPLEVLLGGSHFSVCTSVSHLYQIWDSEGRRGSWAFQRKVSGAQAARFPDVSVHCHYIVIALPATGIEARRAETARLARFTRARPSPQVLWECRKDTQDVGCGSIAILTRSEIRQTLTLPGARGPEAPIERLKRTEGCIREELE